MQNPDFIHPADPAQPTASNDPTVPEALTGADAPRSLASWLRIAEAMIARERATALAAAGVTRGEFRILSGLAADELPERLRERLSRGGKRLFALEARGWIAATADGWELTEAGETVRDRAAAALSAADLRISESVPAAEFEAARATLESLARELGWTEGLRLPRRGPRGHRGHGGPRDHRGHRGHGHREHMHPGHDHGDHDHGGHCHRGQMHPGHDFRGHEHRGHDHRGRGAGSECRHPQAEHHPHSGHFPQPHTGHFPHPRDGHRPHPRGFERGFTAGFAAARRAEDRG